MALRLPRPARLPLILACGGALLALSGCAVAPAGSYVTGTTVYSDAPIGVAEAYPYGYPYGYGYGYGGAGAWGYSPFYGGPAYSGWGPGYYRGPRYGGPPPRPPVPSSPGFGGPRPPVAPLATMPIPRADTAPRGGPPPARFVPRGRR
ncbi:MAG: hypothetical protein PGN26_13895 [Xylophilus ampelinus]